MSHAFRRAAQAACALVFAGLFQAVPARANFIFDLSGTCGVGSGCTGAATGVLTLADSYVFGTAMTTADFISFTYSSSSRNYALSGGDPGINVNAGTAGGINADGSLFGGEWSAGSSTVRAVFDWLPSEFLSANDAGPALSDTLGPFKFTPVAGSVPEPATWAMMMLGYAGLGYASIARQGRAGASSAPTKAALA